MVQQIVDENGTLRQIILSVLNGQSNGSGSGPAAPVTMIQQTPAGVPPTTSSSTVASNPQTVHPPALSASSQAYPFPCCCSCCFCTSAVPGGLPTGGTAIVPAVNHGPLLGFPAGPHLNSMTSARRRTPSRTSYSYSKRQNNNNNQNNSGTMHSGSTGQGSSGFASFPVNPFHSSPLLSSTKPHKSSSKSANLPTGIHMDNMSNIIIPPLNGLNGHHHSMAQTQQPMAQTGDASRKHLDQHNSSELNSGPSVASVVSDLLAKAAAGAKNPQTSFGISNGCHQPQHLQPLVTNGRNQSSSPAAPPLSHTSKTFKPNISSNNRTPVSSPLKSQPVFTDSALSASPSIMHTSSSSVVSSSSVSPNSLDSSYASDKYSEASSDRSDFRSNDCEIMGLIPNGIVFTARQSPSASSPHNLPLRRPDSRSVPQTTIHLDEKSSSESERSRVASHRQRNSPLVRKQQSAVADTSGSRTPDSLSVSREASESPRHKADKGTIHVRDDVQDTRSDNGPKESPVNRKNIRSAASSSSCSSPTQDFLCITSQTHVASIRAPTHTPQSSPSSPVILKRGPVRETSVNQSASSTTSSPAPPEGRKNSRIKQQNGPANDSSSSSDGQRDVATKKKTIKCALSLRSDVLPVTSRELSAQVVKVDVTGKQEQSCVRSTALRNNSEAQIHDIRESEKELQNTLTSQCNVCPSQPENGEARPLVSISEMEAKSRQDAVKDSVRCESGHGAMEGRTEGEKSASVGEETADESGTDEESREVMRWGTSSPKHSLNLPQVQLLNLTYTALTATSVKLKWNLQSSGTEPHPIVILLQEKGSGGLFAHHFIAEMLINNANKGSSPMNKETCDTSLLSRTVYQGNSTACRVLHLQCAQQYSFRVRTVVDHHSLVSNLLTITTPEQALNAKPKHKSGKQQQPQNQQHTSEQEQQSSSKSHEKHNESISSVSDIAEGMEYKDDQRRAFLILLLFTGSALLIAVLIQHLLSP